MAQKIRDDKIGALSHSAGNILMAASVASPAYLTIGGQQFKVTAQLSVALPAMTASQRYQVFAVQTAGVVSLVISTRENSQGPIGYSRWKLVGSLMANGQSSVGFGAFINIRGVPVSGLIDNGPLISGTDILATVTPPSFTTTFANSFRWFRKGSRFYGEWILNMNATGSGGSGDYRFKLSPNLTFGSEVNVFSGTATAVQPKDLQVALMRGRGMGSNGTSRGLFWPYAYDTNTFRVGGYGDFSAIQMVGTANYSMGSAQSFHIFLDDAPISNWSDTPIEDL